MEACEAKELEQMERLQSADFMLSFMKLIMSVILFIYSTPTFSHVYPARLCIFVCVSHGQSQAEAHYKGHKHARKLKALETQRNRQKSGHSPSAPGKDRDRALLGGRTVPTDSLLKDKTGINQSFL